MKNYNSIDLTKFILSIFVITIHCYIVPTIQQPLLRDICMMIQYTAVPLFFCFTGYFLFRRVLLAPEGAKKNIKRAWLRFGKLYLIFYKSLYFFISLFLKHLYLSLHLRFFITLHDLSYICRKAVVCTFLLF